MKKSVLVAILLCPAIALAGATASKFKKENKLGANYWNAQSAIDGKMETAWMVPGDSANLGEWIMLDLPKGNLDKVAIVPGWAESDESWTDYPRIKKLKLDLYCCTDSDKMDTTFTTTIDLADQPGVQVVDVEDAVIGNELFGGKLKLSVVEIYPGADFSNASISELTIYLKEFDAPVTLSDASGESEGHILPDMTDKNPKTFWAAPVAGAGFSFEASGYGLSSIQITHGPKEYARAKTVRITANGRSSEAEIPDKPGAWPVLIPAVTGYTGSAWGTVKVEVIDTYPGTKPELAIAEMVAKATNYEGI